MRAGILKTIIFSPVILSGLIRSADKLTIGVAPRAQDIYIILQKRLIGPIVHVVTRRALEYRIVAVRQ
jgi:hypothetical protein